MLSEGTISRYERGYFYIKTDGGQEICFTHDAIDSECLLMPGDRVEFDYEIGYDYDSDTSIQYATYVRKKKEKKESKDTPNGPTGKKY